MSLAVGMRVRVLGGVAMLAAAALAVGMFTMSRAQTVAVDDTVTPPHAVESHAEAAASVRRARTFDRKQDPLALSGDAVRPAKPLAPAKATAPGPAPAPTPARKPSNDLLPASVRSALKTHPVVVVSLVSPDGAVDELVLREAQAGARIAGAGFVAVGIHDQAEVKRLSKAFSLRQTPSVLVFTSPDRLFVQLTGFVDKEMVAQAATSAPS